MRRPRATLVLYILALLPTLAHAGRELGANEVRLVPAGKTYRVIKGKDVLVKIERRDGRTAKSYWELGPDGGKRLIAVDEVSGKRSKDARRVRSFTSFVPRGADVEEIPLDDWNAGSMRRTLTTVTDGGQVKLGVSGKVWRKGKAVDRRLTRSRNIRGGAGAIRYMNGRLAEDHAAFTRAKEADNANGGAPSQAGGDAKRDAAVNQALWLKSWAQQPQNGKSQRSPAKDLWRAAAVLSAVVPLTRQQAEAELQKKMPGLTPGAARAAFDDLIATNVIRVQRRGRSDGTRLAEYTFAPGLRRVMFSAIGRPEAIEIMQRTLKLPTSDGSELGLPQLLENPALAQRLDPRAKGLPEARSLVGALGFDYQPLADALGKIQGVAGR